MTNLELMCLSWVTANECKEDWEWMLAQAKGNKGNTIDALFIKDYVKDLPPYSRPVIRMLDKQELLQARVGGLEPEHQKLAEKVMKNKILRHVKKLTVDEANAFRSQQNHNDWAIIAKCCASWVQQSEEFSKQDPWIKMGWRTLMTYQLERPEDALRVKTKRTMPLLYRHVQTRTANDTHAWVPTGYVVASDERTLLGYNSVSLILSTLALVHYPDSPFYDGPLDEGFWLLKKAQDTKVLCTDPLTLVAAIEGHKYQVPMHLVKGPDIRIVAEAQHEEKATPTKDKKVAAKARKEAQKAASRIEDGEVRYKAAMDFAQSIMEHGRSEQEIASIIANSRINSVPRYGPVGAPSVSVAWGEARRPVSAYVPWLGRFVTAPRWEFTLGRFSPVAFDNGFIAHLTGSEPETLWPDKVESAVIASCLMERQDYFCFQTAGLYDFRKMSTAEGEMTLWEWYYRMHTRSDKFKTKNSVRMRHLHGLKTVDRLGGSITIEVRDWLPQSFHNECQILLLRELGVW